MTTFQFKRLDGGIDVSILTDLPPDAIGEFTIMDVQDNSSVEVAAGFSLKALDVTGYHDLIELATGLDCELIRYDSSNVGGTKIIEASIVWTGEFIETDDDNDGSVSGTVTATLTGDGFVDDTFEEDTHFSVTNLPTGFTVAATRVSDKVVTFELTGEADAHTVSDSIEDLQITFLDDAFENDAASSVDGYDKDDLSITFLDQDVIVWTGSFAETVDANDGTVSGTVVATLTGDTYVDEEFEEDTHFEVTNLPAGLTIAAERASDTVVNFTITGTASAHAASDSISDLQITFLDAAFGINDADWITGYDKDDLVITFLDPAAIVWAGSFEEAAANDGSIDTSITATLSRDIFIDDTLVEDTHFSVSNLPAGLTLACARTSDTLLTFTATGNASAHEAVNSVADLTITILDDALTYNAASAVTNYEADDLAVNFDDAL